jgi:hypothetical protein
MVGRSFDRHMLSAILLTSSLLLVLGMVCALMWLSALRARAERAAVRVEAPDDI